tara:strand:- start:165 stop:389 length:225 start_codon:yes stop_codon:yes gene_type:complete
MTRLEIENLLKETDFLYCDDVKDLVTNLDEFTAYRKILRKFRVGNVNNSREEYQYTFIPPTKPTIVWDYDKLFD